MDNLAKFIGGAISPGSFLKITSEHVMDTVIELTTLH